MSRRFFASFLICASLSLNGCRHNVKNVAAAPPLPPEVTPQMVSVPPPTHPSEPLPPKPVVPTATVAAPAEPPRRQRKTRKPAAAAAAVTPTSVSPAPSPVQTATTTPPANPLGQLSTGGESTGPGIQETAGLLHSLEARFAGLPQNVQSEHKTEVDQVKRFLTQADEALKTSDTEGARTLAVKAKVLLDEIQK